MLYPVFSAEGRVVRVVMLALVSWLFLGPAAAAREPVWQQERVVVYDYTSAQWDGVIAQTVAGFNAMLPRTAPRLIYRRMDAVECVSIPWTQRGIIACSSSTISYEDGVARGGLIRGTGGPHGNRHVRVELMEYVDASWRQQAACHEFMHAITGIPDNYGANPESCVWGSLTSPGPFDADYAKKMYGKKKRR
jgi:hypothetical protein